jgi:hypothetical protein
MSSNPHPHPTDQQAGHQNPQNHEEGQEEEEGEVQEVAHRFLFFNVMPSWMVSFVTHVALIILLAILWLPNIQEPKVALEAGDSDNTDLEQVDVNFESIDIDTDVLEANESAEMSESEMTETTDAPESLADLPMEDFGTELAGEESSFTDESFSEMSSATGDETSGRGEQSRQSQIRKYGGNAASEKAVELALEWLARHQLPDGGWSLDHTLGPDVDRKIGRDKNDPGSRDAARNGATALALLPFLGRGETHVDGKYKKVVRGGLNFLMKRAKAQGRGLSWHEPSGTMYSHGLVSIVLGEAYAMTGDSQLGPFAQGSIWFIEDAQDKKGGGWRYAPRSPGDTSAVGWQIMAIKSGKLSGLDYDIRTIKLAEKFLDRVSIDNGAWYGYMDRPASNSDGSYSGRRKGVSSVGLLCRMYMGWDRKHAGLTKGVEMIEELGPSVGTRNLPESVNMYYNYYATQIMKHWGGTEWDKWNKVMRDFLVKEQETEGTKKGSWYWDAKNHSSEGGGRLYHTALSAMTLEVYYRYLPLYKDQAEEDEFPLD